MFRLGIPLILAALMLPACAETYTLTVRSEPSGALLRTSEFPKYVLNAPVMYPYVEPRRSKNGCRQVKQITATWLSGATAASDDPVYLCGRDFRNWTLTLTRPDHFGLETDLKQEVSPVRAISESW